MGLDDTKQIPSMLVDPKDPNLVLVAAQGNVHTLTEMRGVFRSTDGGKTWSKTLYVDNQTGAQAIAWAADHPAVMLATTVRHYTPPGGGRGAGGGGGGPAAGPSGTSLFKSTDEGVTWTELKGDGLPALAGRTSIAVAMNTNSQRMYLIGNFGLYRSDDGGTSWRQMAASDRRIANGQGGYNCGVYVDPKNPDLVYTINTSSYKSTDGGKHVQRVQGRAGRRRPAADVDRSHRRQAHVLRGGPGSDHFARRRARPGVRGTTRRRNRSTTSRSTTRIRTGSTPRSRTPARSPHAAAATLARSRHSTGIRRRAMNSATSSPTR